MKTKDSARSVKLIDRCTRYTLAATDSVLRCAEGMCRNTVAALELPPKLVKAVMPDRGHEFARYQEAESALPGLAFYSADPHHP